MPDNKRKPKIYTNKEDYLNAKKAEKDSVTLRNLFVKDYNFLKDPNTTFSDWQSKEDGESEKKLRETLTNMVKNPLIKWIPKPIKKHEQKLSDGFMGKKGIGIVQEYAAPKTTPIYQPDVKPTETVKPSKVIPQNKKKPIIVNDKNDPRLKAYNDSLILSDISTRLKKGIKLNNEKVDESENVFNAYERLTKLNGKSPTPTKSKKKEYFGNDSLGKPFFDYPELYKKPVQPVILEDKPKLNKIQSLPLSPIPVNNKTNIQIPTQQVTKPTTRAVDARTYTAGKYLKSQGKSSGYINEGDGTGRQEVYANGGWLDSFKPPKSRIEAETKLDVLNNRSTSEKWLDASKPIMKEANNTSEIYQSGVNKGKPTGKGAIEPTISPLDFIPALDVAALTFKGAGMLGKGIVNLGEKTGKVLKNLKQETLYKGINPVGYGAKEKIKDFIPNAIKYTIKPNEKITDIGLKLSSNSINTADDLAKAKIKFNNSKKFTQEEYNALSIEEADKFYSPKEVNDIITKGENRSDAFRIGLGLEQKNNTFNKIGDNLYRINPEKFNPTKGHLVSIDNDINTFLQKESVYSGEHPGVHLMEKYNKVTSPTIKTPYGEFSINDISNYLKKPGDKTKPWQQTRIVEKSKNPKFENSVYDADQTGIMGSHRWDVKKTSEGNLHYQSNDTWDINPWENRGKINVKNDDLSEALRTKHFKSPLQNIEKLKVMGGKPFNIQNNFIVNPKDYSVIHKFKQGGWLDEGKQVPDATKVKNYVIPNQALIQKSQLNQNKGTLKSIDKMPVKPITKNDVKAFIKLVDPTGVTNYPDLQKAISTGKDIPLQILESIPSKYLSGGFKLLNKASSLNSANNEADNKLYSKGGWLDINDTNGQGPLRPNTIPMENANVLPQDIVSKSVVSTPIIKPEVVQQAKPKLTNFEQRISKPTEVIKNNDGTVSTHKMMSFEADGKYYAAPTIVKQNGKLVELSQKDAIDYAFKNNEFKEFKTDKEAKNYANNGYKKGTPLETKQVPSKTKAALPNSIFTNSTLNNSLSSLEYNNKNTNTKTEVNKPELPFRNKEVFQNIINYEKKKKLEASKNIPQKPKSDITDKFNTAVNVFSGLVSNDDRVSQDTKGYIRNKLLKEGVINEETIVEKTKVDESAIDSTEIPFQKLATVRSKESPNDNYISYRRQASNSEGLRYIPTPRKEKWKGFKKNATLDKMGYETGAGGENITNNVEGIAHFLIDADISGDTKFQYKNTKASVEALKKDKTKWLPVYKKEKDGSVIVKYTQGPEEFKNLEKEGYTDFANLRQMKVSDINWKSEKKPVGFGPNVRNLTDTKGKDTFLLFRPTGNKAFKGKDAMGKFEGNSLVMIFKDSSGKAIMREYAGSLNGIISELNQIKSKYKIKDNDITLGFYDAGSYSAKPEAKNGVLKSSVYGQFNDQAVSGAALAIPTTTKKK